METAELRSDRWAIGASHLLIGLVVLKFNWLFSIYCFLIGIFLTRDYILKQEKL